MRLLMIISIMAIIALVGCSPASNTNTAPQPTSNAVASSGASQQVTLSLVNGNYYPSSFTVKANEPVSITLDNSVRGCFRTFTIPQFQVSKYSASPSQTIEFTPTQTGSFRFACGMGMGYGTIVVQ